MTTLNKLKRLTQRDITRLDFVLSEHRDILFNAYCLVEQVSRLALIDALISFNDDEEMYEYLKDEFTWANKVLLSNDSASHNLESRLHAKAIIKLNSEISKWGK